MSAIEDHLSICLREQWQKGLFYQMECNGDTLQLSPHCHAGAYCLPPVDSGEKGFVWSRLAVSALLPQDCTLRVYTYAADTPDWAGWQALQSAFAAGDMALDAQFGAPQPAGTDCWLQEQGRYLWIALALAATGGGAPQIHALSLRMGGDHMVDYLPAIYQGQDFTTRYLSIFNTIFQDMEDAVEALPHDFDAMAAPEEMLAYLAGWVCAAPDGGNLRSRIRTALQDYESMYTVEGVKRSVKRLTGQEPFVIEHFMVDPNLAGCCNPALYRRLYGENPYRFFLLLAEDAFSSRDQMEWFLSRMQQRIPAGMELELVLLKPCVQLDWHTYLGINSCVGSHIPAVINETVTIHYDTMIGGAKP